MKLKLLTILFLFAGLLLFCGQLHAQKLYVGANYHPHDDKNIKKIKTDIGLMKVAGLNVVRMGHLAWDSYEPAIGQFDFRWFDEVMDLMDDAGIKLIFDIAIRPAPLWLHHKFPSIDIVGENGDVHYPKHSNMDDVGDPNYQIYALRFTDEMTKHYASHPALLAFGIDIESAYVLQKLKQVGDATQSMSYWVFTEILEETGPRFTPFHRGFGMLNIQGINNNQPRYISTERRVLSAVGGEHRGEVYTKFYG